MLWEERSSKREEDVMNMWPICGIIFAADVAAAALYQIGYGPLFILFIIYMAAIQFAAAVAVGYVIVNSIRDSMRKRRNRKAFAATLAAEERQTSGNEHVVV